MKLDSNSLVWATFKFEVQTSDIIIVTGGIGHSFGTPILWLFHYFHLPNPSPILPWVIHPKVKQHDPQPKWAEDDKTLS